MHNNHLHLSSIQLLFTGNAGEPLSHIFFKMKNDDMNSCANPPVKSQKTRYFQKSWRHKQAFKRLQSHLCWHLRHLRHDALWTYCSSQGKCVRGFDCWDCLKLYVLSWMATAEGIGWRHLQSKHEEVQKWWPRVSGDTWWEKNPRNCSCCERRCETAAEGGAERGTIFSTQNMRHQEKRHLQENKKEK